jgi:alkylation response protein AidB-like acyl-CoA dehydrogenase
MQTKHSAKTAAAVRQPDRQWLERATLLARAFALTAAARDRRGGTPTEELQRLREEGFLTLLIPTDRGGAGGDWKLGLAVVREIAGADASLAHLLGYHYHFCEMVRFFGTATQHGQYQNETAHNGWFWGGAINARDPDLILHSEGGQLLLRGRKTFCTGARVADTLIVSAREEATGTPVLLVIPARRPGIVANDDWDNMGQRQTESGSVTFTDVMVMPGEILGPDDNRGEPPTPFATLSTPLAQLVFVNLYVGIGLGAFNAARAYTLNHARPWLAANVDSASQDPYIIEQFGNLWADLAAATALADRAESQLLAALAQGHAITERERGEVAVTVASAKVVAARVGLRVTSAVFDVMGARATTAAYAMDRFWRNMRTHTLHDPVAYKVREVGDFVLNDVLPTFSNYS